MRLALLCGWGHGNSIIIVVDLMTGAHLIMTTSDDHCCVCYPLVTSLAPPTLLMGSHLYAVAMPTQCHANNVI